MLKFLLGVIVGTVGRDPLRDLFSKLGTSAHRQRLDAAYFILRYGCLTPETHNYGCQCVPGKENR